MWCLYLAVAVALLCRCCEDVPKNQNGWLFAALVDLKFILSRVGIKEKKSRSRVLRVGGEYSARLGVLAFGGTAPIWQRAVMWNTRTPRVLAGFLFVCDLFYYSEQSRRMD